MTGRWTTYEISGILLDVWNQAHCRQRRSGVKVLMPMLLPAAVALAACGSNDSKPDQSSGKDPSSEMGDGVATHPKQYIGDAALWHVGDAELSADSDSFTANVQRVGCAGGETGEVLRPEISTTPQEVLVTFTVERLDGVHRCPGNDRVPYEVVLPGPVGDRALIDGTCRSVDLKPGGCILDGLRWTPERGVISEEADE